MFIELTNKYTKDYYSHYKDHCDKYFIKKEDLIRFSSEQGEDIESYWSGRYKENHYVYFNENGTTKKVQIDYSSFIKLKKELEE